MKEKGSLNIIFADKQETFSPGDTLRGAIVLNVNRQMAVQGLRVKFKGRAEVSMFVGDYDTEREYYLREDHVLLGFGPHEEGPTVSVDPGYHEYPFEFALPETLPYSFSVKGDEYGIVKYSVMAILHVPTRAPYTREKFFTVRGVLDLATVPDSKEMVVEKGEKRMRYLCWTSGVITASLITDRKGFVPGETINVFADIFNGSSQRIRKSRLSLVQLVALRMHSSRTFRKRVLCCHKHGPVLPGDHQVWTEERLVIPDNLPPSFLKGCHLMNIYYLLKLDVVPAGCSSKLTVPLTIILGSHPLAQEDEKKRSRHSVTKATLEASFMSDYSTLL